MVLVCHPHRFVYLKTHKTASTSCEAALEHLCAADPAQHKPRHVQPTQRSPNGIIGARGRDAVARKALWWNHMPARRVALMLGPWRWCGYTKIAVLRNPYDRAVSYYFHRLHFDRRDFAQTAEPDAFVEDFRAWLPTARLRANENKLKLLGRVCVDHLFYFEQLESDLLAFKDRVGDPKPLTLPRFKSKRRKIPLSYTAFYDDAARAVIERENALEIALGDYRFEGGPGPKARRGDF